MEIDVKEVLTKFKNSIRDAADGVVLMVEGAAQQVSEARQRRDKAIEEANAALAESKSLREQISRLTPERDALEAKVAILKKAIASVASVNL